MYFWITWIVWLVDLASFDAGFWIPLISGVISAIAAITAVVVSVVVAHEQKKQAERQENFEIQLTNREERRHLEIIDAQVYSFLQNNSAERQLLPLCFSAAAYDKTRPWCRKIYRDFCCLPLEVQNRVFSSEELSFRLDSSVDKGFFDRCIKILEKLQHNAFPEDDKSLFHDSGKYLKRCLNYSNNEVPVEQRSYQSEGRSSVFEFLTGRNHLCPYEQEIVDVLSDAFENKLLSCAKPIKYLADSYGFELVSERSVCKFVAVLCIYLAIYGGDTGDFEFGCAQDFFAHNQCTMEDLFLYALNSTYVYCCNQKTSIRMTSYPHLTP